MKKSQLPDQIKFITKPNPKLITNLQNNRASIRGAKGGKKRGKKAHSLVTARTLSTALCIAIGIQLLFFSFVWFFSSLFLLVRENPKNSAGNLSRRDTNQGKNREKCGRRIGIDRKERISGSGQIKMRCVLRRRFLSSGLRLQKLYAYAYDSMIIIICTQ